MDLEAPAREAIQSDQPILSSAQDSFGRRQFAHRIAEIISKRPETSSLVIAVNAPWGDGKTSVLNMIEEKLSDSGVLILKFNPWRYPNEDRLLINFFKQLAGIIDAEIETKAEKAASQLQKRAPLFGLLNFFGFKADDAARAIASLYPDAEVEELKSRISERLKEKKQKVIILMDDIDRLDVDEIQAVFRLVKLSAGFSYTSYVLAFDDLRVSQALRQKYAGIDDSGSGFLEKIVQASLTLPPINPTALLSMCQDGIEAAVLASRELDDEEQLRLTKHFRRAFRGRLMSPRLCKRFANSIQFALPLMRGEVDLIDMIFVEALKTFVPEVYAVLRSFGDQILDFTEGDEILGQTDESLNGFLTEKFSEALKGVPGYDRRGVDLLLQELIPEIQKLGIFEKPYEVPVDDRSNAKRLSRRRYYWRYFSYGIQPHDISDESIREFVADVHEHDDDFVRDRLAHFFTETPSRADLLIDKLRGFEGTVDKQTALRLLFGLSKLSDLLPPMHPDDRVLMIGPRYEMARLIISLLRNDAFSFGRPTRKRVAIDIIRETPDIRFGVTLADFAQLIEGRLETTDNAWGSSCVGLSREANEAAVKRISSQASREPLEVWDPDNAQSLYVFWYFNDAISLTTYVQNAISAGVHQTLSFLSGLMRVNLKGLKGSSYTFQRNIPLLRMVSTLADLRIIAKQVATAYPGVTLRDPKEPEEFVAKSFLLAFEADNVSKRLIPEF